jgi:phospholipase/carboxylesterase
MATPPLLQTIEHATGADPAWAVVWLHGLGADGHDFAPIVPELVRPGWPAIRFVFPHAPQRAVTINGGMRMRAWYDIRDADLASRADAQGVEESVAQVDALIAHEATRGIPASRVILAGFSQGGAITLACGLRRQSPLAGLLALSAYLPMSDRAAHALAPAAASQPVFMAHGSFDPVVPLAAGLHSAAVLQQLGFRIDWHAYAIPHSVSPDEVRDIGDWLAQRFTSG